MDHTPPEKDEDRGLLDRARRALREGRLDDARSLGEAALEGATSGRSWEAASALSLLGDVALRRGRPGDALLHLEESIRLAPRAYTASLLVRALYRSGQWEEGVARCRGFLEAFPGDVHLRVQEVLYHFEKEEFTRAEEILRDVLADAPDDPMAKSLLVDAKTRAAPPAERVRELEGLFRVESRRNDPQLRYLQGRNRMQAGDPRGACEEYAAAVSLDPKNRFYRRQLAFALNRAGRYAEAASALRELFLRDPRDMYVRSTFQSACRASGNLETLRETIREALRRYPDQKFLHGLLRKAEGQKRKK